LFSVSFPQQKTAKTKSIGGSITILQKKRVFKLECFLCDCFIERLFNSSEFVVEKKWQNNPPSADFYDDRDSMKENFVAACPLFFLRK